MVNGFVKAYFETEAPKMTLYLVECRFFENIEFETQENIRENTQGCLCHEKAYFLLGSSFMPLLEV